MLGTDALALSDATWEEEDNETDELDETRLPELPAELCRLSFLGFSSFADFEELTSEEVDPVEAEAVETRGGAAAVADEEGEDDCVEFDDWMVEESDEEEGESGVAGVDVLIGAESVCSLSEGEPTEV